MSNPYNLKVKKKKAPKAPHTSQKNNGDTAKSDVKSQTTNAEKLKGYKEVTNRDKWKILPIGAEIKYMKNNGVLIMGGAVIRHGIKDDRPYLVYFHQMWKNEVVLYHDQAQKIWAKPSAIMVHELNIIEPLKKTNADLLSQMEKMKDNLRLMNEFMIIKYGEEYKRFMREKQTRHS